MIPTSHPSGAASSASPTLPTYATPSLYVGDLNPDVTDNVLYEIFNGVAPVESVRVCRDASKKSLRYAYVNYRSVEHAEKALEALNYTHILGKPCRIMWSRPEGTGGPRSNEGNLYIKNLDASIDTRALHDTFSLFGNILSCKVATDEHGQSRGYGFVQYETLEAAEKAIAKLNGLKLGSKEVFVTHHQKRTDRIAEKAEHFTNLYVREFPASWNEETLQTIFSSYGPITSVWLPTSRPKDQSESSQVATPTRQTIFACVNFRESQDAKAALKALHGKFVDASGVCADQEAAALKRAEEDEASRPKLEAEDPAEETIGKAVDLDNHDEAPLRTVYQLYVDKARDKHAQVVQATKVEESRVNVFIKNLPDKVDDEELRKIFEGFGRISSAKVMKDEEGHSKGFGFVCFTTAEEASKAIAEMHMKYYEGKPLYVGLAEQKDKRIARLRKYFSQQQQQQHHQQQQQHWRQPPIPHPFAPPVWKPGPSPYLGGAPPQQAVPQGPPPPTNPMMTMLYHPGGMMPAAVPGMPPPAMATAHHVPTSHPASQQLQKQILGEKLFPLVYHHQPTLAGKITGMMLDMEEAELQILLNDENELRARIDEAIKVLKAAAAASGTSA